MFIIYFIGLVFCPDIFIYEGYSGGANENIIFLRISFAKLN